VESGSSFGLALHGSVTDAQLQPLLELVAPHALQAMQAQQQQAIQAMQVQQQAQQQQAMQAQAQTKDQ
jgi:hypothetical protein